MNSIGKYGHMAENFMRERDPQGLENLIKSGEADTHFSHVNEQAYDLMDQIKKQLQKDNLPPQGNNFIDLARYNNWLHHTAEEIMLNEFIFK